MRCSSRWARCAPTRSSIASAYADGVAGPQRVDGARVLGRGGLRGRERGEGVRQAVQPLGRLTRGSVLVVVEHGGGELFRRGDVRHRHGRSRVQEQHVVAQRRDGAGGGADVGQGLRQRRELVRVLRRGQVQRGTVGVDGDQPLAQLEVREHDPQLVGGRGLVVADPQQAQHGLDVALHGRAEVAARPTTVVQEVQVGDERVDRVPPAAGPSRAPAGRPDRRRWSPAPAPWTARGGRTRTGACRARDRPAAPRSTVRSGRRARSARAARTARWP